jgi:hypothetical protein
LVEDQTIWVTAVDGGRWQVECALTGALTFLTEVLAQEKARALALWVAGLGLDARVVVLDQSRALLATARYFADEPDALAAALLARLGGG